MKILYICDHLPTFILNEILGLKSSGNEVLIWADSINGVKGKPVGHKFSAILMNNGLFDKTFCRVLINDRKKKLIYLIKYLIYDFSLHPLIALKTLVYALRNYPQFAIQDYFDMRNFISGKIDIIHAPFSTPHMLEMVYFLSKIINVPYTLAFRAHDIYEGSNLRNSREKVKILNEATQIITTAQHNNNIIKGIVNGNKDLEIIHSSVNLDLFTPENKSRLPGSIISVCRLTEEKGTIYLLQACHLLNQRGIEYSCKIIGDGPERMKCERLVYELQIPHINFVGYLPQDKIKAHLNNSTVFVLPCIITSNGLGDILPNAVKEAMAMKVPVITSDIRGIEELVDNDINGIIVPPKDPDAIADAIEKVFSDSDLRERMGNAGRMKIENNFNVIIEVGKLEKIFKHAVLNNADSPD